MVHVDNKEIQKLLDVIQTCELAVARLNTKPPAYLGKLEVDAYKADFNAVGAKTLVEYYRLTAPLFRDAS